MCQKFYSCYTHLHTPLYVFILSLLWRELQLGMNPIELNETSSFVNMGRIGLSQKLSVILDVFVGGKSCGIKSAFCAIYRWSDEVVFFIILSSWCLLLISLCFTHNRWDLQQHVSILFLFGALCCPSAEMVPRTVSQPDINSNTKPRCLFLFPDRIAWGLLPVWGTRGLWLNNSSGEECSEEKENGYFLHNPCNPFLLCHIKH